MIKRITAPSKEELLGNYPNARGLYQHNGVWHAWTRRASTTLIVNSVEEAEKVFPGKVLRINSMGHGKFGIEVVV